MSHRLPWLLFAVSLAANVFFAAGVGYTVYKGDEVSGSPEARMDVVAERLGLTATQHEALDLLRERAEVRRPGMRAVDAPLRAAILKEVAQPDFDRGKVLEMIKQRDEERRPYYAEYAEDLHGFLVTLTPEQRQSFLEMANERHFLRRVYMGGRSKNSGSNSDSSAR
jgi:Spy/CpxP family protein refolding chaperone